MLIIHDSERAFWELQKNHFGMGTATVLLAEDDRNDAFLLQRAFQKAGLAHRLVHVVDGQQAIDYLGAESPLKNPSLRPGVPDLMLLDLKMPRLSGFEVLEWVQARPELKALPVVVLSSSDQDKDRAMAKQLGAADYCRKPSDPAELVKLVRQLDSRWLQRSSKRPD